MPLRIGVASHATIDHICRGRDEVITVGGPVCYSGLMVKHCTHDIIPITKFGSDFINMNINEIDYLNGSVSKRPTTRFKLVYDSDARRLFLLARCEDIGYDDIIARIGNGLDACIVSPVIDELSMDSIRLIASNSGFTLLDPQGLVRNVNTDGSIAIAIRNNDNDMDLSSLDIDALKVDSTEAYALTSLHALDALSSLSSIANTILLTIDNIIIMSHNSKMYKLTLDRVDDSMDSTGVGDIFTAAYTVAYVKDRDAIWALCYAAAASYYALRSNRVGISKIPYLKDFEHYAYILQERVKD